MSFLHEICIRKGRDIVANQEHLAILMQGVSVWNYWREKYMEVVPDLRHAILICTNLIGANLTNAYLVLADLTNAVLGHITLVNADLSHANLTNANLDCAVLNDANLSGANLTNAYLINAILGGANLSGANLTNASLNVAVLTRANLSNANLSGAHVGGTLFGNLDLRTVKGLETLIHEWPSTIGIDTMYKSGGDIPEAFLRGAGVPDTSITHMHTLVENPIDFYSCFISYSSRDRDFAEKLYADLQSKKVRCWYAPHNMKTGDRIRPRIHEQIWVNDRLLLILSASSVESSWVDYEVETALARELKEKRDVLFPIRLDDAVKESKAAWATHIQSTRHITDLTRWKEYDEYQNGLNRLLRDLKQADGDTSKE
jgi:uncharacterized protein YjbI with pentapeptide repeats